MASFGQNNSDLGRPAQPAELAPVYVNLASEVCEERRDQREQREKSGERRGEERERGERRGDKTREER